MSTNIEESESMNLAVVQGNLLDATEQYIVHQCNSLTVQSAGIARRIFDRFPYADIYRERTGEGPKSDELPGNIVVRGNGQDLRFVINLMGQYYPGHSVYPDSDRDGIQTREKAFEECLKKIAKIPNITSIAFPWKIGCNLAGGDWISYRKMIKNFALDNPNIYVKIYQYE